MCGFSKTDICYRYTAKDFFLFTSFILATIALLYSFYFYLSYNKVIGGTPSCYSQKVRYLLKEQASKNNKVILDIQTVKKGEIDKNWVCSIAYNNGEVFDVEVLPLGNSFSNFMMFNFYSNFTIKQLREKV